MPLPLPFWREGLNYKQTGLSQKERKLLWENTLLLKMLRHIEGGRIWGEFDYASISACRSTAGSFP